MDKAPMVLQVEEHSWQPAALDCPEVGDQVVELGRLHQEIEYLLFLATK
jgi:hypothetical protein